MPFPKATVYRSSHALELLHTDLCGPISPTTLENNRYIFVIIDGCTRYIWSILLKKNSDAFEIFRAFKTLVKKDVNKEIKTPRTDKRGEFTSKEFKISAATTE